MVRDPEIKYGQSNTCVAMFSVAVRRKFHRDGDPDSDFFNCKAFGKTAEFVEKHVTKGTKLEISGRLTQDRWTDKDGQNRTAVSVIADSLEFAESKSSGQASSQPRQQSASAPAQPQTQPKNDDFMDIPAGDFDSLPFN